MEKRAIRMNAQDNVATVLCDVQMGDTVLVYDENQDLLETMTAQSIIPYGNKIALTDMKEDDFMVKYGEQVGIVSKSILKGHLVHVHNVRSIHLDIPDTIIKEIINVMNITE